MSEGYKKMYVIIWKIARRVMERIEQRDEMYVKWYSSQMTYAEYCKANSEYLALIKKHGTWEEVVEQEPDKAYRLENLLA